MEVLRHLEELEALKLTGGLTDQQIDLMRQIIFAATLERADELKALALRYSEGELTKEEFDALLDEKVQLPKNN